MKMWYFQGETPNFGDELNPWLWPRLLPNQFDSDDRTIFLGIGSILFNRFPRDQEKVVFGAGFGGYSGPPDVHDGSWRIRFVRGPETARLLKLDASLAIADPAILVRLYCNKPEEGPSEAAFMPHFASLKHGHWERVCSIAGLKLIDPRRPVDEVLAAIRGCRMLITEAMHGAIVADALRIPWIAVRPVDPRNRMKWRDWAASLGISLRMHSLLPSSWTEAYLTMPNFRLGRGVARLLGAAPGGSSLERGLIELAAIRLRQLAGREASL